MIQEISEGLRKAPKFRSWIRQLVGNGLKIHAVREKFTRFKHDGDLLFALLMLEATTPEGDKLPPVCFIKGSVVSVLICLIDQDTRERYLLLVKQRRICNGDFIYEQVAGMVDGEDEPHDVAVRETEEETGLRVTKDQVHPLNDKPYFVSSGTSDESIYFYYAELEMSREEIAAYDQQEAGLAGEHERIYTHIATIDEARRLITNVNGLLNIHLYLDKAGV
ncbi:MAG: hypothetical protein OHK0039_03670 [Bacteroidia bacterium]